MKLQLQPMAKIVKYDQIIQSAGKNVSNTDMIPGNFKSVTGQRNTSYENFLVMILEIMPQISAK